MYQFWSLGKQNLHCHFASCSHIGGKDRNLSSTYLNVSYFHNTVPMWNLTMMEQNHYSVIDSLQCKSFWKSDYLQSYKLRVIISATSCISVVLWDVALKTALPSNLYASKVMFSLCSPSSCLEMVDNLTPLLPCASHTAKIRAEVWNCNPRGNSLP